MSNPDSTNPTDHLTALYDEEELLIIKTEPDVNEDTSDDEDSNTSVILPWDMDGDTDSNMADAGVLSPLPHSRSRSRSRSPVWVESPPRQTSGTDAVIIRQCDPDGTPSNPTEEDFLTPDQHRIFEFGTGHTKPPSEPRSTDSSRGGRRRRGRGSRGGGSRVRRNQQRSTSNAAGRSAPRHPITEIYLTDNDLPEELIELVQSVIRQREIKEANRRRVDEGDDVEEDAEDLKEIFTVANDKLEWSSMESFRPTEEVFKPERTGPTATYSSAYSAFRSYWDDEILSHIVRETNAYAAKMTADDSQTKWVPTNIHEVLVLFGFWIMLGIIRMPTYTSCFSRDPLLETTVFRRMFTCKRYEFLVRSLCFHSRDNFSWKNQAKSNEDDPIAKIRPILTHLNSKFQANYTPSKNICIDESLLSWTGNLHFPRSFQSRPKDAPMGIKTYELCESATGYLWSFFVSTGNNSSSKSGRYSKLQKSTAAVLSLIEPLLNKGYRVFMDHLFNSPLLARFLKRNGTDCVGTLQPDQQHVPPLLNICELENGQMIGRHTGDVCVMAWQGQEDKFTTISTCHGLEQGISVKNVYRPQVVLDYKKHKGGVDRKDEMLEPYLLERRRSYKWYIKLFKRLLNYSIFNSRILLESSSAQYQDHLDFRLRLVDEILNNHNSLCPLYRSPAPPRTPAPSSRSHWLTYLPDSPAFAGISQHTRKRCVWCAANGPNYNKKSIYMCEECKVPLCVIDCFKNYHLSV